MKLEQILPAVSEKACIWDIFAAEERLWDIESELLEDQRYYENRLRAMGAPDTAAERTLAGVYKNHIQRIRGLLARVPQPVQVATGR